MSGYGWLSMVMGGYPWLWVGYEWLWVVMG